MSKIKISAGAKTPAVAATEYRLPGRSERVVGANGEINASSKRDLLSNVFALTAAASRGEVITAGEAGRREQLRKQNNELLAAARNDASAHRILGEKMSDALYITGNREGFLRMLLTRLDLQQGQIPRFKVYMQNVTAVVATEATQVQTQIVEDKWIYPPEIELIARPFVPLKEMNQSPGDVLAEKFVEAQTSLMVAEDRLLTGAANRVVGLSNDLTVIAGQLTPYTFAQVANNVERWGLKSAYALLASDFKQDIIGNAEFQVALDPVARHELLLTGMLGTMYGMPVLSDAYRHPEHKVLNPGEFYVFSDPLNLGAYADRGGIDSQPTDITQEKVAGKGWVLTQPFSMALASSRAVAKGLRV